MQRSEAPERIWATGDGKNGSWTSEQPSREWQTGAVEYALSRGEALTKAEAENARLRECLSGIRIYCNDTLSGRIDGPDDREWQRAAVIEVRNRAHAALGGDDA